MKNDGQFIVTDLETVPNPLLSGMAAWDHWKARKESRGEPVTLQDAGLYGEWGMICCAGFMRLENDSFDDGRGRGWTCTGLDEEAGALEDIHPVLNSPDVVLIGHNIKGFDIPFLCKRYLYHGMNLPKAIQLGGKKPWEVRHIDTMEVLKFGGWNNISLEAACALLHVPSPKLNMAGYDVYECFMQGKLDKIKEYCLDGDVKSTAGVFRKLVSSKAI